MSESIEIGSLVQDKFDYEFRLAVVVSSRPIDEGRLYVLLWSDGSWENVTELYLRRYLRVLR